MKRFEAPTEPTGETPDPYEKRRLPMANRKRSIQMKFYVTEEEKRLIDEKMAQLPTRRYGAYLRICGRYRRGWMRYGSYKDASYQAGVESRH